VVVFDFRFLCGDIVFRPFSLAGLRRQKSRSKLEEGRLIASRVTDWYYVGR
jgi:hypothetical protein